MNRLDACWLAGEPAALGPDLAGPPKNWTRERRRRESICSKTDPHPLDSLKVPDGNLRHILAAPILVCVGCDLNLRRLFGSNVVPYIRATHPEDYVFGNVG